MDVVSGSFRQPSLYLGVLVCRVIVDDQVHLEFFRDVIIYVVEKLEELLVAVPALALRHNLAGGDVQGGKQRRGAVPEVIVGYPFHVSQPHGQKRLGTFQRLRLALLVDTKHDRRIRRVQIQSDNVVHFLGEEGIGGQLEVLLPVGRNAQGGPDALHLGFGYLRFGSDGPARPMGAAIGWFGGERLAYQGGDVFGDNAARSARPAFIVEPHQPLLEKAVAPGAHALRTQPHLLCNRPVAEAVGAQQNDMGTSHESVRQCTRPGQ